MIAIVDRKKKAIVGEKHSTSLVRSNEAENRSGVSISICACVPSRVSAVIPTVLLL